MKITFIQSKADRFWESLGIGYIASYIKKNYRENLDINFFHGNFDNEKDIIRESSKSDIVAFSCTTPTFENSYRLASMIKDKNPKVCTIFGGWHTTTDITDYDDVIDFSVIGEGENTLLGLLVGKVNTYEKIIGNYKSIVYGDLIDINKLEWPNRELIKQDRMLDLCESMCGERIGSFQSRRGCPINCIFCGESCMTRNSQVRVRDTEDLLNEIEYVYNKYNLTMFKFVDPTWCYPKSAAKNFCEAKIKRSFELPWEGMGHASFLNKEMLQLMKEAGCKQINIGVESGSQKLLNNMKKGVTISKIKKVFKWCKEVGIESRAFFILGMPEETIETVEQTRQFVHEIKPNVFGMTILTPFPGTNFYDSIKHKNIDWSNCDEYSNNFWETKNFTNAQLRYIQSRFNNEFKDILVSHQRNK